MEYIYFFPADVVANNPDLFKACGCDDIDCKLLVFDNGFTKNNDLPTNVIQYDFIEKKKI
jgi:hypothetical protein